MQKITADEIMDLAEMPQQAWDDALRALDLDTRLDWREMSDWQAAA